MERGDPRYATLVRGFNLRWVGHPRHVELCYTSREVLQAVQGALDLDRSAHITVRGGGHCYEDFVSSNEDGVIIDLTPMHAVYRDAASGAYIIEGGATLWDVYTQLYRQYGVTLPGGSCYSVGVGGHVTGGGYGLLSRLHGLTVDYLTAVEVVHVAEDYRATLIRVGKESTRAEERDLFWAHLGGGGGNFGIVTRFWFENLPSAPSQAYLATHAWNWEGMKFPAFARLVRNYGQFLEAHSQVGSPYQGLFTLLHLTQSSAGQLVLTAQYVGSEPARLDDFLGSIAAGLPAPTHQTVPVGYHHLGPPTTAVQQLPWLLATQTLNGSGPNRRFKNKSAYMQAAFPERQIDVMWESLAHPRTPNSQALLQVDSYGCQVNAVPPNATAVPQRSSVMKLQYQTYWNDPSEDADNLSWIRKFYTDMYGYQGPVPDGIVDGCYVNYPDVDLVDWPQLYYKDNYPRLQAVKSQWDPHNIFHHRQSVRPINSAPASG
ncbi:MAG: FAD-binding oxidoreductase [Chloroflexi bacterium]|nr:FAD-binding oxidoreductase [Chloroflexota bacterium]